jgi:hypothetical protein
MGLQPHGPGPWALLRVVYSFHLTEDVHLPIYGSDRSSWTGIDCFNLDRWSSYGWWRAAPVGQAVHRRRHAMGRWQARRSSAPERSEARRRGSFSLKQCDSARDSYPTVFGGAHDSVAAHDRSPFSSSFLRLAAPSLHALDAWAGCFKVPPTSKIGRGGSPRSPWSPTLQ